MKLKSILPIHECRSILSEQIGRKPATALAGSLTSRAVGVIEGDRVELKCGIDRFSKKLVGTLRRDGDATLLEGEWQISFWSGIWGDHKIDEEEILGFLRSHASFHPST